MNGIPAWLLAQLHTAGSVVSAIAANKPAPARNVIVYTTVLIALAFALPKIIKAVSK